jgi:hypothetical protein
LVLETFESFQRGDDNQVIERLSPIWLANTETTDGSVGAFVQTLPIQQKVELMMMLYMSYKKRGDTENMLSYTPYLLDKLVEALGQDVIDASQFASWYILEKVRLCFLFE